jgi:hypothetical protein
MKNQVEDVNNDKEVVENDQTSFDKKMNNIASFVIQLGISILYFLLALYMRKHLPVGTEAGWWRGMLDGGNWLYFWGYPKTDFMTYPHSIMYLVCYWASAVLSSVSFLFIFVKSGPKTK